MSSFLKTLLVKAVSRIESDLVSFIVTLPHTYIIIKDIRYYTLPWVRFSSRQYYQAQVRHRK
jgi:hypothetical protein